MPTFFEQADHEQFEKAWAILAETIPQLGFRDFQQNLTAKLLFMPQFCELLATHFVVLHRREGTALFLTDSQLHQIADEKMIPGRVGWENNIGSFAGIYIFVSLTDNVVFKVGETSDMQDRVTNGHLRYGTSRSDLIAYCKSRSESWPECIRDLEIILLMLPMHGSNKEERCVIERGLQNLLPPETW